MKQLSKTSNLPTLGRIFDDLFSDNSFNWNWKNYADFGQTLPSVNLEETEQGYSLEVAAPGMKKEDFKISLNKNNVLTISSEQQSESEDKGKNKNYYRREFNYSAFKRTIPLPSEIDAEKIEAQYTDGILKIQIPKNGEEKETTKKIEVK